ncbi:XRE family transcriptional regulator [Sphingobacteriales bacterium UPWRP_1]|nr:hypothetical protein B6N25_05720 [Sphingobacteriales bacterium TSM_CSS]PSJ78383.1 XRE family transcriptional regulator [Sphingobacteriales bacterium UPWRP_1]
MNTILKKPDSEINIAESRKAEIQQALHEFVQRLSTFENEAEKQQFKAEKLHLRFMGVLEQLMQEKGMNRKQLADELQTSKSYITQLFTADRLLNITLLARLEQVFGVQFQLQVVAINENKEAAG